MSGNLTSLTPPGGDEHGFGYDSLDLLASYDPPAPDAGAWATTHAYDADRQLDFTTEPDGSVVDPAYDPASRLDTLTFPRGTVDVAYDAAGRVSILTAPDLGRIAYAWDGFLPRGESWTGAVAGSVTRTYDTDFRLRTQSVNAGSTVTLNYDADKLLTSLTGAVALTVRRDATNGSMTGTTAGAVVTAQTFSGYGELDTWSAKLVVVIRVSILSRRVLSGPRSGQSGLLRCPAAPAPAGRARTAASPCAALRETAAVPCKSQG